MPRLPRVTSADIVRALRRARWYEERHTGSHVILRHSDHSNYVTVAEHPGRIVKLKTLRSILDQAHMSVEEFVSYL